MNCFNIRELQGILKRKFFSDLIDSNDYKILLKDSMVSLRFKLNTSSGIEHDTFSFYKFGTNFSSLNKSLFFNAQNKAGSGGVISAYDSFFLSFFKQYTNFLTNLEDVTSYSWVFYARVIIWSLTSPSLISFTNITNFSHVVSSTLNSAYIVLFNSHFNLANYYYSSVFSQGLNFQSESAFYYSITDNHSYQNSSYLSSLSEVSDSQRFTRFSNTIINYDYKTGNYIGSWDKFYPYLINSLIEVTRGIKKSS
jgi:hypothetical protein